MKAPINALNREDRTRMMRLARAAQPQPLGMAVELALTTGMRRGEVCALRWSDLGDDGAITVNRALGNADGGFYEKEPKTSSSRRKPLSKARLQLRHTFATMMIAGGNARFAHYVRTVASYLGHASVSMALNIYADVDPDAKKAAVSKVQDCFDMDFDLDDEPVPATALPAPGISFTTASVCQTCPLARLQRAGAGVEPAKTKAMLQARQGSACGCGMRRPREVESRSTD